MEYEGVNETMQVTISIFICAVYKLCVPHYKGATLAAYISGAKEETGIRKINVGYMK